MARLEHVNVTVPDPRATAAMLSDIFGWKIRWEGNGSEGGYSIHIGTDNDYIALYTGPDMGRDQRVGDNSYLQKGGLNHIGIVVDDLGATEAKVKAAGITPHSHMDYEPGKRFYFHDADGVEYEVVNYD